MGHAPQPDQVQSNPRPAAPSKWLVSGAVLLFVIGLCPLIAWAGICLYFSRHEPSAEANAAHRYRDVLNSWHMGSGHVVTYLHGAAPPVFTGSATLWYEVSASPDEIPAIDESLKVSMRKVTRLPMTDASLPDWWHPEKLKDATIWSSGGERAGEFFVTSRCMGEIYYYRQGK